MEKLTSDWELEIMRNGYSDSMPWLSDGYLPIGGDLGNANSDFVVSEIPAYMPCGSGEHLYLWIEKCGKSTQDVTRKVEEVFQVRETSVGCAGKKDVHAITRQWVSVETPSDGKAEIETLNALGWMKVLQASRHTNKIRMGHLRGNHFAVCLYGVTGSDADIEQALRVLSEKGFVNYFGKQRFGFNGDNVASGISMLRGRKARHQMMKLYVSALQSAIFNLAAGRRFLECGFEARLGDVIQKLNGGCFVCDDPETDNERILHSEIAVTLALPGKKVMHGTGYGESLEQQACSDILSYWSSKDEAQESLDSSNISKLADGTRRTLSCLPEKVSFHRTAESTVQIEFALPAGSFATVFLRHLCGPSFTR